MQICSVCSCTRIVYEEESAICLSFAITHFTIFVSKQIHILEGALPCHNNLCLFFNQDFNSISKMDLKKVIFQTFRFGNLCQDN